jgi:site-specific DNA recombinase
MRVGLYPRVSGIEQAQEGYSIGEQIDRMKKYCEAKGWTVYKIYTDAGFTGANMERPGLQEMIKDSEANKFDMVLVYKLDRLSRSQKDVLYLVEDVFDKHGVFFSSMTENFDTSTPFGKAILGILAVFAQLEREQIRERTMMGKKARAMEGKWHGGSTEPIGYDYNVIDDMLYINEYEAMQIREIADLFLKMTPVRTIETICLEKGYKHKYGVWAAKTIKGVLANPINIGLIKDGDDLYQGLHEPIFDKETFDAIQVIMNERKEQYGTSTKPHTTLLGGMLYCKCCGGRYAKQNIGKGNFHYICYSRSKKMKKMIKDPNCQNKNYPVLKLDVAIINEITKLSISPEYVEQVRESKPLNDVGEKIKTINKEIEGISSQISNLMDLYSLGNMPIDVINQKVSALNETKTALEKELDSLDIPDTDYEGMTTEQIQTLAAVMNEKDLTLEEKRKVVQSLIYYIEIDKENIYIHWKF